MTIEDFHINFDIELDKSLDFEYPYISAEVKDYWLNKAQDRFIYNIIEPKEQGQRAFEETTEKLDAIRTIISTPTSITPTISGTRFISGLPDNYMHRIRHRCTTLDTNCGSKTVGGELVTQFQINNVLKDPFWTPDAEYPIYYITANAIEYETLGKFTVTNTSLVYVKKPAVMRLGTAYTTPVSNIQCELPEVSHDKILAIAVSMVLENIESQRYQTNLNELNKI